MPSLSEGLKRYGEGVKWVVSLATGILTVGGFLVDPGLPLAQRILFSAAALSLTVAILAGVLCGLHVVAYASHGEAALRAAADGVRARERNDQDATREAERGEKTARDNRERGREGSKFWWPVSLSGYMLGMLFFVLFAGVRVWGSRPAPPAAPTLTVISQGAGADVLVQAAGTGQLYRLVQSEAHGVEFVEVPFRTREETAPLSPAAEAGDRLP